MTRALADARKIERLMARLGREARGAVDFFHYDLRPQALSKIERGLDDANQMLDAALVDQPTLRVAFEELRAKLLRYPSIDEESFAAKLDEFLGQREEAREP